MADGLVKADGGIMTAPSAKEDVAKVSTTTVKVTSKNLR
jgi:hypothetical protein